VGNRGRFCVCANARRDDAEPNTATMWRVKLPQQQVADRAGLPIAYLILRARRSAVPPNVNGRGSSVSGLLDKRMR
jgi:hypothetical protein